MSNSARSAALSFLARRERSEYEMREHLLSKNYSDEEVEDAIDYLYHYEYLDDEAYAGKYIRDKINFYPCGSEKLRQELEQKGVPGYLIERSLLENFDADKELALAIDLLNKKKANEPDIEKKRRYLYQKGFPMSIVYGATGGDA